MLVRFRELYKTKIVPEPTGHCSRRPRECGDPGQQIIPRRGQFFKAIIG